MEKIPKILTHDVAGQPDEEHSRVYFEREIRSYDSYSNSENKMINKISNISRIEDLEEKENHIRKLGKMLGKKILEEVMGGYNRDKFDIKGVPRGGAYLQQFITKVVLLEKNLNILKHPAFIEEFEKNSNNFLSGMFGIKAVIKGAESVADYYHTLSGDLDIVFTGLSIHLDTRHSIDMLIGRSESQDDFINQVDLCEIKSSEPRMEQIESIHEKHISFIKAHKEIILNGLGTIENKKRIEQMSRIDEDVFTDMVEDRMSFLSGFMQIDKMLPELNTWEDIKKRAEIMNVNPVLLAVRLRNVTDASMIHLLRAEREEFFKLKNKIFKISIPTSELGLYQRLIKDEGPHIGQALTWKSIVAYKTYDKNWKNHEIIIKNI